MKSIYFAYTFNEGFNNTFHTGPMAKCNGQDVADYGIPFIVDPSTMSHGVPALGELFKYAEYMSESTFFELQDLHTLCLNNHRDDYQKLAVYLEEIIEKSPFTNHIHGVEERSDEYMQSMHM